MELCSSHKTNNRIVRLLAAFGDSRLLCVLVASVPAFQRSLCRYDSSSGLFTGVTALVRADVKAVVVPVSQWSSRRSLSGLQSVIA